jgi:hypothetical protein
MPKSPTSSTFADRALAFLENLRIAGKIPAAIEVLNPYHDAYTMGLCEAFYKKYYNDNSKRTLMVGINPGRFGSGATGVSFTDPIKLETICGIPNTLTKKPELSADFIYAMIDAYGGPKAFYKKHFISAVSPLGFTSKGKNINYYDDKSLQTAITPFVEQSITTMLTLGIDNTKCFCIGEGKNLDYLTRLNDKHGWFKNIIPLAHPRFIMQYKRKKVGEYIDDYLAKLQG